MPNYCLNYQLDFAVSLFKQQYAKVKEISREDTQKKWVRMSLESSAKKRGKYGK